MVGEPYGAASAVGDFKPQQVKSNIKKMSFTNYVIGDRCPVRNKYNKENEAIIREIFNLPFSWHGATMSDISELEIPFVHGVMVYIWFWYSVILSLHQLLARAKIR